MLIVGASYFEIKDARDVYYHVKSNHVIRLNITDFNLQVLKYDATSDSDDAVIGEWSKNLTIVPKEEFLKHLKEFYHTVGFFNILGRSEVLDASQEEINSKDF